MTIAKYLATHNRTDQEDPLKVFRFLVEIDGFARAGFTKLSGIEVSVDVVEYREGGDNAHSRKSPGQAKYTDAVLARGEFFASKGGDADMLAWFTQTHDASAKISKAARAFRRDVDVVQMNREGLPVVRWRLYECWVSKFKPFEDLDAKGNTDSIETMTLSYERFLKIK